MLLEPPHAVLTPKPHRKDQGKDIRNPFDIRTKCALDFIKGDANPLLHFRMARRAMGRPAQQLTNLAAYRRNLVVPRALAPERPTAVSGGIRLVGIIFDIEWRLANMASREGLYR